MTVVDQVRQTIAARRVRDELFGKEYFWDHAWEILLRLFLAKLEERRLCASDLFIESGISAEIGVRWIKGLRSHDYLRTYPDVADRRGIYVELTADGAQLMENYFDRVAGLSV